MLQRLEDSKSIEEIFGIKRINPQNLVYPSLTLKQFESFAEGMTQNVDVTNKKGFWTTLSDLNPDTFQKLFSELCRPILSSKEELNSEFVITSLHGIFVILEKLRLEFEVNHKGKFLFNSQSFSS